MFMVGVLNLQTSILTLRIAVIMAWFCAWMKKFFCFDQNYNEVFSNLWYLSFNSLFTYLSWTELENRKRTWLCLSLTVYRFFEVLRFGNIFFFFWCYSSISSKDAAYQAKIQRSYGRMIRDLCARSCQRGLLEWKSKTASKHRF